VIVIQCQLNKFSAKSCQEQATLWWDENEFI